MTRRISLILVLLCWPAYAATNAALVTSRLAPAELSGLRLLARGESFALDAPRNDWAWVGLRQLDRRVGYACRHIGRDLRVDVVPLRLPKPVEKVGPTFAKNLALGLCDVIQARLRRSEGQVVLQALKPLRRPIAKRSFSFRAVWPKGVAYVYVTLTRAQAVVMSYEGPKGAKEPPELRRIVASLQER
jgi:hypothetical protein